MNVSFECFMPKMELIKTKDGRKTFLKGFVNSSGFPVSILDFREGEPAVPFPKTPVTVFGELSRKTWKDRVSYTVFVSDIIPYGG